MVMVTYVAFPSKIIIQIFLGDYVLRPAITITVFNLSVAAILSAAYLFIAL
jgi:hypothetical protein